MSAAAPIIRAITLTEQVASNICQRIVGGLLAPGERLVEQTLARELGVGQNVIREALISLAHRGFVKRFTNRGTYVTQLTFAEAQKLAEVRAPLETLVCDKIQERMRSEQLDLSELRQLLFEMRAAAQMNEQQAFHDHDLRFHQALWALAGNEYLSAALEQIVVPLFAFYIVLFVRQHAGESALLEAVEAHEKLVLALEDGGESCAAEIGNLVNLSLKHHQGLLMEA